MCQQVECTATGKLIAIDLDGTLLNHKKQILQSSKQAIAKCISTGDRIVIASGRSLYEVYAFAEQAGCDEWVIGEGGTIVANRKTGTIVQCWPLDVTAAIQVCQQAEVHGMAVLACVNQQVWMEQQAFDRIYAGINGYQARQEHLHIVSHLVTALQGDDVQVTKLFVWGTKKQQDETRTALGKMDGVQFTSSGSDNFEVLSTQAGKGAALCWLANKLGMTQTAAIGDAENDLDMLRAADFAISMGDGDSCVKEIADFVTTDCDTDGIVRALDWLAKQ